MQRLRFPASAAAILLVGLLIAVPSSAQQFAPVLSPGVRATLLDATNDHALPAWQSEFAIDVAGGRTPGEGTALRDSAAGADGTWQQLPPPSARSLHVAVYDPVGDRMVVFGGYSTRDLVNDVWALSLAGTPEWSRLSPAGTPPSARHLTSAIYDPVRRRMIVFGGLDRETGYRDDLWALSLDATPTWSRISPAGTGPAARARHCAVYDPVRDRMIVFGGYSMGTGPLNDTWALSLSDPPAWTPLLPGGAPPPARYDHSAIYDPVRDRIIVFGGFDGQARLNDTWSLTLAGRPRWRPLDPTGPLPTPRLEHAAIFDPVGDRMVVFSGLADGYISDAWSLSLEGRSAWTRIDAASEPSVRWGHSAIYDPVRARMVVFGGTKDGYNLVSEIWGLSLSAAPRWTNLTTPDTPPGPRLGHSAVYDDVHQRMVLFGGYDPQRGFLNDVWVLSLAGKPVWTMLQPSGTAPSPREGHAAIYDPARDRMLVFGGQTDPFSITNEVWALSLSGAPAWTQVTPAGEAPEPRTEHTAIDDAPNDRMVIYAGVGAHAYLRDVWALSLGPQPTWTQLAPWGTLPDARFEHSAIYDPLHQRMVVFGGLNFPYFLNDVWGLSLGAVPVWSELAPAGTKPAVRAAHRAIYDPNRNRMVVFGGFNYSAGPSPATEAWALTLDRNEWILLQPAGSPPPGAELHSAVYDPVGDRMLVFGGHGVSNDLWALDWGSPATLSTPPEAHPTAALGPHVRPNPSRGSVTISFDLGEPGEASVRIYDAAGRAVRTLAGGILPAGPRTFRWDRRTAAGVLVQPGLYFCEVRADARTAARRIVLIR
jgi:galactose oxidase-like protein/Kelch motif protein/flagellar hook capping protein FlgD